MSCKCQPICDMLVGAMEILGVAWPPLTLWPIRFAYYCPILLSHSSYCTSLTVQFSLLFSYTVCTVLLFVQFYCLYSSTVLECHWHLSVSCSDMKWYVGLLAITSCKLAALGTLSSMMMMTWWLASLASPLHHECHGIICWPFGHHTAVPWLSLKVLLTVPRLSPTVPDSFW